MRTDAVPAGMNLNHLAIFQAVAACGSVSAGAQRLRISQSAASRHCSPPRLPSRTI